MDTTQVPLNWAKFFCHSLWSITKLCPDSWKWCFFKKHSHTHDQSHTWLSQTACDSARFVGFLTASSAGLLDWGSMISFSSSFTREASSAGRRPALSPALSGPSQLWFKESLFAKRFINWDTVIGNLFCSQDTSSWIREKRYNAHKRDFVKGNKNAKCQIREPLHSRGEICAGPYNRGREKGGWYTWHRGPCELRCAG